MWKLALIVYWGICFALTHVPGPQVPQASIPHLDKVIHFGMYLLLSILFSLNFPKMGMKSFLVLVLYAAIDELTQPYFQRDAEIWDGLADSAGILLGIFIAPKIGRRFFPSSYNGAG